MLRWTTKDGHYFQARFVRLRGDAIVVARDGFQFTVSIFALTPMSLEMARRQAIGAPLVLRATPVAPGARVAPVIPVAPVAPVASFSFGPSILAYCQEKVGQKIGNGQCAALAAEALKNAGAAVRAGTDWPGEGDYVWGDSVAFLKAGAFGIKGIKDLAHVEAGDIVQFHSTRFSGYNHADDGVYQYEALHHTAIVESVDPARKTLTVLHQNWNGHQSVRRQVLFLRGMTSGWMRFYRPIPTTQEPPAAVLFRFPWTHG